MKRIIAIKYKKPELFISNGFEWPKDPNKNPKDTPLTPEPNPPASPNPITKNDPETEPDPKRAPQTNPEVEP